MSMPVHLLPRFHAWCTHNHIPSKKPPFFKRFKKGPAKKLPAPITVTPAPHIPSDILKHIVSFLPLSGIRSWRLVSHAWRQFIDSTLCYWKKAELEMIEREFPAVVLHMFGGAEAVQKIPVLRPPIRTVFRHPCHSKQLFEVYYRMTWLDPTHFPASVMRGIDPNGLYSISISLINVTLNKNLVMTLQEGAPAFTAGRRHFPYGWVVSVTPYADDGYVPYSGDFCLMKDREMLLCEESFIDFIDQLISKGQSWQTIGTFIKVNCLFQLLNHKIT